MHRWYNGYYLSLPFTLKSQMRADDPGSNAPFRKLQRKEECSKVPAGAFIFNLFSISLLTLAKLHLPMFHINEYAQKVGGINGLVFSFLPEF